ncbi:GDP-mannose 4,6-dehydratase [Streptococcus mitis]
MRLLVASDFELELSKQIDEQVDLIVYFVAESFNDKSLHVTSTFVKSNIVGKQNLLNLARKYDIRFHHISTDEVYGDFLLERKDKFTEKMQYNPSSPYAATKASADLLVKAWVRSFGVRATISNCSKNYGSYLSEF